MESREQRIATLAATLKASGIAKSESQAKMMAEDMVGVEEHVQRNYEERHAEAREYLNTAKNLGLPRQKIAASSSDAVKPSIRPEGSRMIEPLPVRDNSVKGNSIRDNVKTSDTKDTRKSDLPFAYTDIEFKGKTLSQAFDHDARGHDTHNAALEAIKSQVSVVPVDDLINDSSDDISNASDDISGDSASSQKKLVEEVVMRDVDDMIEAPEAPKTQEASEVLDTVDTVSEDIHPESVSELEPEIGSVDNVGKSVDEVLGDDQNGLGDDEVSEGQNGPEVAETLQEAETVEVQESPKLDAQKLVELMEEDGKLEEHTREIKEKPTNVKPKEAYEENNIDLGSVFNFNKR